MSKKRKAGQGTLRKRSDGRWEGRIVIGYNEKGLPITKGVTASEKGKCLEKLEKLKQEIGIIKSDTVKPNMPFGEWIDFCTGITPKCHYAKPHSRHTRTEYIIILSPKSVKYR